MDILKAKEETLTLSIIIIILWSCETELSKPKKKDVVNVSGYKHDLTIILM